MRHRFTLAILSFVAFASCGSVADLGAAGGGGGAGAGSGGTGGSAAGGVGSGGGGSSGQCAGGAGFGLDPVPNTPTGACDCITDSNQPVTPTQVSEPMPQGVATGGTLKTGSYSLESATYYQGSSAPRSESGWLYLRRDGTWSLAQHVDSVFSVEGGSYVPRGPAAAFFMSTCPAASRFTFEYTVTADTVTFYDGGRHTAKVFRLGLLDGGTVGGSAAGGSAGSGGTGSGGSTGLCDGIDNFGPGLVPTPVSQPIQPGTAQGGTLPPGAYFLISETYVQSGTLRGSESATLYFRPDGTWSWSQELEAMSVVQGGTYSMSGTELTLAVTCPMSSVITRNYTVTRSEQIRLTLYDLELQTVQDYGKQ